MKPVFLELWKTEEMDTNIFNQPYTRIPAKSLTKLISFHAHCVPGPWLLAGTATWELEQCLTQCHGNTKWDTSPSLMSSLPSPAMKLALLITTSCLELPPKKYEKLGHPPSTWELRSWKGGHIASSVVPEQLVSTNFFLLSPVASELSTSCSFTAKQTFYLPTEQRPWDPLEKICRGKQEVRWT